MKKYILQLILIFGISFLLLEGTLHLLLTCPILLKVFPKKLTEIYRSYYFNYSHEIIQYDPSCAQYDQSLFYTLKPGKCEQKEIEFKNTYKINTLGLRDDESSLEYPDMIVLGDSHAMGWGVEQNETFAQLIEENTGLKVLNAGISSYGTVREFRMLSKLNTSQLKYLLIQYNDNDYLENQTFYNNGNILIINSQTKWEKIGKKRKKQIKYYFGKYLNKFFIQMIFSKKLSVQKRKSDFKKQRALNLPSLNEAELFLNAVMNENIKNLDGVQIILFKIRNNKHIPKNTEFIRLIKNIITDESYPKYIRNMSVLDIEKDLNHNSLRYILDNHITSKGHKFIAEKIIELIQK